MLRRWVTKLARFPSASGVHTSWTNQKQAKKRAIFITGCDSGFGYSLALHLLEKKATYEDVVVLAGCYCPGGEDAGAKSLLSHKAASAQRLRIIKLDVTNEESVVGATKEIENVLDELDCQLWCLFNNAATLIFADAALQTYSQVRRQFDVNVIGAWSVTRSLMPHLIASRGRVVNMISFCSSCPLPTLSVYTSTKSALMRLSEGMRIEVAKYGVDVVLYNPGDNPRDTPLCSQQAIHYKAMGEEIMERYKGSPDVYEYFKAIEKKFTMQFPTPELHKIDNPGFYKVADDILTADRPYHIYTNAPWMTRAFFWTVNHLPARWGDFVRTRLMFLPPYPTN